MRTADVIIAGGGVAGSTLAILLARCGLSVELFERATFPREKPCGEGIMPGGMAVLRRMGLENMVGGLPFRGIRFHFAGRQAVGRFPRVDGYQAEGRGQRRSRLDQTLFRAAADTPGVRAREAAVVQAPIIEQGSVRGVFVNGVARRAPLTIAADGARSRLRRELGLDAPVLSKRVGARAHFLLQGEDQAPWVDVFACRGYELYVAPLPGRELLIAALAEASAVRGTIEASYRGWIAAVPALAERLRGAEQISKLLCAAPLRAGAKKGFVPGLVLLGDAAGFIDPITGGGITQALTTAELLAGYISRCGAETSAEWLPEFERARRSMLRDYRLLTEAVLWLSRTPQRSFAALAVLRLSPPLFSHLLGVSAGMRSLIPFQNHAEMRAGSGARAPIAKHAALQ